MLRSSLRAGLAHVGVALREPEEFALRWDREKNYGLEVWLALGVAAACGTALYGATMGIGAGLDTIARKAVLMTLSAGFAWAVPIPALYVLNSLTGSRLRASTTLIAALVTTSWGGLALIASVPIAWFFSVAAPAQAPDLISQSTAGFIVGAVNFIVFTGVGVSMGDVFARVMEALEPRRRAPIWFLALVGMIGWQLFYLLGLFG